VLPRLRWPAAAFPKAARGSAWVCLRGCAADDDALLIACLSFYPDCLSASAAIIVESIEFITFVKPALGTHLCSEALGAEVVD
jgi:hypothetical protein